MMGTKATRLKRRNPSRTVAAVGKQFERFHGYPATAITEHIDVRHETQDIAVCGELTELVVLPLDAVDAEDIVTLNEFGGAVLGMNANGTQLYIHGGEQSLNLEDFGIDSELPAELEVLGWALTVDYRTTKTHLGRQGGSGQPTVFTHDFGEGSGRFPVLLYDTLNREISFAGGGYTCPAEGITD